VLLTPDEERRLPQRWRGSSASAPGIARGEVLEVRRGINTLTFTTRSATDALLVIPDWWDAGWSAAVDGQVASVLGGNCNQQVLPVPAGLARVSLRYHLPAS
jgi:uncharacterized membrane protein YfhO